MNEIKNRIYLVTSSYTGIDLFTKVEAALQQGVAAVQYREKNIESILYRPNAFALRKLCADYNTPFIVNDNIFLARDVEADGLHIGQNDIPLKEAKSFYSGMIGVSCNSIEQALDAQIHGATYIGIHIWESAKTKPSNGVVLPVGVDRYSEICKAVTIPCVGIGGVTAERVPTVLIQGDYAAIASNILLAENVQKTVRDLNFIVTQNYRQGFREFCSRM